MGLLDFLSPALTAATTVANGVQSAKAKRRADDFAMAMQAQQAERQARQDAARDALNAAQIRNLDADNARQAQAALDATADRLADNERQDMAYGIEPEHLESGQDVGELAETPDLSPPPPLTIRQPGAPAMGTLDPQGEARAPSIPAVPGAVSPLTPLDAVITARRAAKVGMRTPDKVVPRQYNPDKDPRRVAALDAIAARDAAREEKPASTIPGTPEWEAAQRTLAGIREEFRPEPRPESSAKATAQVMRLSTQFDNDPIIKNAKEVAQGVEKVRSAASDPSAAGDMALLYGVNKILDPGSVVRESEFATAAKSGSLDQRIQGAVTKLLNGQRLTPEQRKDFLTMADRLAQGQRRLVATTIKRHSERGTRMNVDPRDIVYDPLDGIDGPPTTQARGADPLFAKYGLTPKGP